jgi:hypothetical protein
VRLLALQGKLDEFDERRLEVRRDRVGDGYPVACARVIVVFSVLGETTTPRPERSASSTALRALPRGQAPVVSTLDQDLPES